MVVTRMPRSARAFGSAGAADDARRIMRATVECFCEDGYEKASIERIAARAGVTQGLLNYHFQTKAQLFESTMNDLAKTLFDTASARLRGGKSVRDGFTEAADLLYALYVNNLDAVTFMVECAAAANHSEILRTAYVNYRDTQRWHLAEVLYGIAGDRAPRGLIDETVRLIEMTLLGMSMQRPFVSDEPSFRADFDAMVRLVTSHFIDGLQPSPS